ncbi:hypothetical protein EX30DRAFT_251809 [Ascodesmis nigricans]|uniref:Uncharacterized protein n=1 Tax=Ascodesmis nigricans TaxID=341454 RepID=A0A4S2MY22_9PEZI|nr:hypothetical protein EX30DRAFT_251809 [Ascodesmis nigricans]
MFGGGYVRDPDSIWWVSASTISRQEGLIACWRTTNIIHSLRRTNCGPSLPLALSIHLSVVVVVAVVLHIPVYTFIAPLLHLSTHGT